MFGIHRGFHERPAKQRPVVEVQWGAVHSGNLAVGEGERFAIGGPGCAGEEGAVDPVLVLVVVGGGDLVGLGRVERLEAGGLVSSILQNLN